MAERAAITVEKWLSREGDFSGGLTPDILQTLPFLHFHLKLSVHFDANGGDCVLCGREKREEGGGKK